MPGCRALRPAHQPLPTDAHITPLVRLYLYPLGARNPLLLICATSQQCVTTHSCM
jgi:hypothetical protein